MVIIFLLLNYKLKAVMTAIYFLLLDPLALKLEILLSITRLEIPEIKSHLSFSSALLSSPLLARGAVFIRLAPHHAGTLS